MTDGNTYAINKYLDDQEAWDELQEIHTELEQAEARIEELEAKLAKAVDALSFYADPTYNGYDVCLEDYGLSMTKGCVIQDGGNLANKTLAELSSVSCANSKGQDDE